MSCKNRQGFLNQLKDPGTLFALGNVFLFSQDGGPSFTVSVLTLVLCLMVKIRHLYSQHCPLARNQSRVAKSIHAFLMQQNTPLFINGAGCLTMGVLALFARSPYGLICGLGFGFGNIKLALELQNSGHCGCADPSSACQPLCQLFNPIVLIALGMISAGLFSGGSSLWAFPLIALAMLLALKKTIRGKPVSRAWPQMAIAGASLWYSLIGCVNHNFLACAANALFTVGFVLLALLESCKESEH